MKNALTDWPVWFQLLGALAVVVAVGVLAGPGWALLAGGAALLAVGVLAEMPPPQKSKATPKPAKAEARS